jgi:hypothetical protein
MISTKSWICDESNDGSNIAEETFGMRKMSRYACIRWNIFADVSVPEKNFSSIELINRLCFSRSCLNVPSQVRFLNILD